MAKDQGVMDAAVLMMSLGEEVASEVFKHLTPKEVQKLGEAIAKTKSLTRERVDEVVEKFSIIASQQSLMISDSGDFVRGALKRALGDDKAALLLDRIMQGGDVSGIESLKWMEPLAVAELLRNEHPQIVATILVHLDFDQAADVLKSMTERQRDEVMLRIATLEGIQPGALKDLNEVLAQVLSGGDKVRKASLGGVKTAAEMVNLLGTTLETRVLDSIRAQDPELAQKIVDKMLVFDDLKKLDDKSIRLVLKEVPSEMLIVALKGAQPDLKEHFLANMSTRAAESLREDLESRGPMRLSDVEAQQKEIIRTVRRLAEEGEINLGGAAEEAMI